uniref:Uncharacterized protein n=1 Tax=Arundo donax TaxID=35708 RepID=A0A0A9AGG1_ARUDO
MIREKQSPLPIYQCSSLFTIHSWQYD